MAKKGQKTETELRLFEAALRVFGDKGHYGANTQEIADQAQVTKASLHYYYRHKDDLYEAAFEYAIGKVSENLYTHIQEGMSAEETLRTFCDRVIRFYHDHPWLIKMFIHECLNGGKIGRAYIVELGLEEGKPLSRFIENINRAVERGEIRPVDPYQLFFTTLGSCAFPIVTQSLFSSLFPELREDPSAFLLARREHVFETIYFGLTPSS